MVIGVCTACFRVFMFYSRIETGINYTHIQGKKKQQKKRLRNGRNAWGLLPFIFFFLPLSLSITLSIITQQLQKWWSKHSLNFFSDCSRRRRRSVARVTTTLLPKPRRGRTERERVLWPVYLDNPTCRIRIEKGSRSLSFSCQPYSIKKIKKKKT